MKDDCELRISKYVHESERVVFKLYHSVLMQGLRNITINISEGSR